MTNNYYPYNTIFIESLTSNLLPKVCKQVFGLLSLKEVFYCMQKIKDNKVEIKDFTAFVI